MNGRQAIFSIYRKRYERENSYQVCEPYFHRVIGISDESEYDDTLTTLEEYMQDHQKITVFFDGIIPLEAEFDLINSIKYELSTMNVYELSKQDITISPNPELNKVFLIALEEVVLVALGQETFFSDHVRNDFITKLIIWSYSYLMSLNFEDHYLPKCIYYGAIERHAIYFLMLAYKMGIDVLYLNPLKEELFDSVDTKKWSTVHREMGIVPIESFEKRAARGTAISQVESVTKMIQREVHDNLFDNTGIFKPWQFRGGYTRSLTLDTILEDVFTYWQEQARMRQAFKVVRDTVHIPCFFFKVDGIYQDVQRYKRLVNHCVQCSGVLFFNTGKFSNTEVNEQEMYQLMFCQLSDGTFNISELKKLPFYRFSKYSEEVQDYILKKFNELITTNNVFTQPLSNNHKLRLLYLILTMNEDIVRMVDNHDFSMEVPKLVIYLNKEDSIAEELVQLLGYLNKLGWDIVIFNPSGLFNMNLVLQPTTFVTRRLETMHHDSMYGDIIKVRENLFTRFKKLV